MARICESIISRGKRGFAGAVKSRIWGCEAHSGLAVWDQCDHKREKAEGPKAEGDMRMEVEMRERGLKVLRCWL